MSLTLSRTLAPAPATTRGQPLRFSLDAKGEKLYYAHGNSVYIRPLDTVGPVEKCDRHTTQVTCVSLSPNGNLCASGDKDGNVIVWATGNADKTEKLRTKPISGVINDISWSDDNQRICVVGEGKGSYGAALLVEGGSSVGEIKGHSKVILSCDFRKVRPYRIATGGADSLVAWNEGPPFKFHHSVSEHQGNVNIVRFSPDGSLLATSGADKSVLLLDGKTGEKTGKIVTDHSGSIYSLCFSANGKQIVTAGADKTVKIFRAVDNGECVSTTVFDDPSSIDFMQLGVAVAAAKDCIVSVGLNGDINVCRPEGGSPALTLAGHQKMITALAMEGGQLISAGSDGRVLHWINEQPAMVVKGLPLKNVTCMAVAAGRAYMAANDDSLLRVVWGQAPTPLPKVSGGVVAMALLGDQNTLVIATSTGLFLLVDDKLSELLKCSYEPSSMAAHGDKVWVGGRDKTIHVYSAEGGGKLTENKVLRGKHNGAVTAIAISPDGTRVAAGDANREVVIYDVASMEPHKDYISLVYHNTRINCVAFSPSGNYMMTGSLDTNIIVWNLTKGATRLTQNGAHTGGVTCGMFLTETEFVTGGSDAAIRFWKIPESF